MTSEIEAAYGPLSSWARSHLFPDAIVRIVEWPWASPLRAILQTCGWSIDHVISDPRAAREVRGLWRIWKESRRLEAERQRMNAEAEVLWWRRMGCPVPCPVCGVVESCDCDPAESIHGWAPGEGTRGLDLSGAPQGAVLLAHDPRLADDGLSGL